MKKVEYFSSFLKFSNVPCFVAELDTNIVVYSNKAFENLLPKKQQIVGVSYDDLVTNNQLKCPFDFSDDWKQDKIYSTDLYVSETHTHYTIINTKMEFLGVSYNLSQFVKKDLAEDNGLTFEEALTHSLSILQQAHDTVLVSLMELLARYYQCERAYVYRINGENSTIRCTAQWSADPSFIVTEEVDKKMGKETDINATALINWAKSKQEYGIICINEKKLDEQRYVVENGLLETFDMRNCVFGVLVNEQQEVFGIVGFSNFPSDELDFRLIRTMIHFVAQHLNQETIGKTMSLMEKDALTGICNRAMYSQRVDYLLHSPPKSMGVISANVNGLKQINDNLGITEGDKHIKETADKLKAHFGYEFYRLSGDEFVGLAPDVDRDDFEKQVVALHQEMKQEGSYGFAIGHAWDKGSINLAYLLHEAETLMYINKQEYYSSSQRHFSTVNNQLLTELLSYLENEEFMIYLQPQVRLVDGSLYGAEALIRRFDKSNQKMVFPDQFISLYEQNSIIRHVDIFVVETVCKLLKEWSLHGKELPVSVNLSRVTLQEYGIVDTIVEICDRHQVPHCLLVIEVTERVGLIENNVASTLISSFKENGFNISLDDFGCAYSNIVTLAQIEVDEVKIDKSLVDNVLTNEKNHILVKNVLSMCNELEGSSTLAEGIEVEAQALLLHKLNCHLGQGYFYSRPIPVAEFEEKYISTKKP